MRCASTSGSANGRPRTNIRSSCCSCSMHIGPIVSVSQPNTVHCMTIGMSDRYPLVVSS